MRKLMLLVALVVGSLVALSSSVAQADHFGCNNGGYYSGGYGGGYQSYSYYPTYAPVYQSPSYGYSSYGYAPSYGVSYYRPGLSVVIGSGYRGSSYGGWGGGYRGHHHHHHGHR